MTPAGMLTFFCSMECCSSPLISLCDKCSTDSLGGYLCFKTVYLLPDTISYLLPFAWLVSPTAGPLYTWVEKWILAYHRCSGLWLEWLWPASAWYSHGFPHQPHLDQPWASSPSWSCFGGSASALWAPGQDPAGLHPAQGLPAWLGPGPALALQTCLTLDLPPWICPSLTCGGSGTESWQGEPLPYCPCWSLTPDPPSL